ncbi:B3 domain-containing transcription repressor VAL2-like isoform X2 [Tripterygium wilfordii]|uniref:B3 domain-containing transcription repressor VAL2-like isoform X2 n=1 Tax=Tripterygium wilfordii TaxID=458696 RepID=UPI0018F8550A|nr:B3 domain-containing transcription repressor VAL2-like isoform X2 [Tripterygium wilfordii]
MASSKTCMNVLCGTPISTEWRKGWALQCGGSAVLCDKCGSAYEQSIFCDVFHAKDSGWRECNKCGKRLHCGCIASRCLVELLDRGGVICIGCAKCSGVNSMAGDGNPNGSCVPMLDIVGERPSTSADCQIDSERKHIQFDNNTENIGLGHLLQFQNDDTKGSFEQFKREGILLHPGESGNVHSPKLNEVSNGSSQAAKPVIHALAQTNLSITLGSPLGSPNPFSDGVPDERGYNKASPPFQQGLRSRHLLPKPPKSTLAQGLEGSMGIPQICVARPPAEGRGRNQLLPRYWPRITDQELQQISGDTNSTIVPLFEKVLSASDAGRIGRLVLPKACAEAYFPPISQPEGLPLRIQDVKGKEWVFQFRFWPNNNSRMYVLEGVTPCIQSMQLQAGDTVIFSRMDPEGKLVMGFRKASKPITMQSLKGSNDPHLNALSKHFNPNSGDISWLKSEKHDDQTRKGLLLQSLQVPEKKRLRNIGSKSKRLLIDNLDALELRLSWEEAQDLLCPPLSVKPSIVTIDDHDFEEYEEPPVFGKRSIFVVRSTGGQEQWAQCDSCSKWRRFPVHILLPPKWACGDNSLDQSRYSCSAPEELTPSELENLLRSHIDFKKRKMVPSYRPIQEHESSGLDALANAAILGDNVGDPGTTAVATTTRHPRHRPGCSCIVCIQPPSGKGKHKPTCTCNVCMTVKRRFKTLMMRKKKRQSEREAEIAQRNQQIWGSKDEAEVDSLSKHASLHLDPSENETKSTNELESKCQNENSLNKLSETGQGNLDLNSHPDRVDELRVGVPLVSMTSLLQVANLPLETYLKQNGLTSLMSEQEVGSVSPLPPQTTGDSEGQHLDDSHLPSSNERESSEGEENGDPSEPDLSPNDPQ